MTGGPSGSLFCCRTAAERRAGCAEGENACGLEASLAEKDAMFLLSAQREGLPALVRKEERHAVFCSPAQRERWHCRTKNRKAAKGDAGILACPSGMRGKVAPAAGKNAKFFAGKCLTVWPKRRIKPFAPTKWPCPQGRRGRKFSRMAKKFLTRV